jgi:hypothetical protein
MKSNNESWTLNYKNNYNEESINKINDVDYQNKIRVWGITILQNEKTWFLGIKMKIEKWIEKVEIK